MNVLWFVLDTLRSDHLSCYGYFRPTSPNIDRLAAQGALFEDSYASAIATGPGFTSLFTGLAAINHGFYLTPWGTPNEPLLDDTIWTLPEQIQQRGNYTTAAFDNLINFRSHMKQFVRGFEYYVNITRSPGWLHHFVTAGEVNHRLLPWLDAHADEPFFAFVHYWDPHIPYNMPPPFRGHFDRRKGDLLVRRSPAGYEYVPGWGRLDRLPPGDEDLSIDLYDDEILYTDHCVGQVVERLDCLNLLDHTVIIVTSDHGEDLDLHGIWGHATVHETTIRVPLIVRVPGLAPTGVRVAGFVQHADQAPTILEYFPPQHRPDFARVRQLDHLPLPPGPLDGVSLLPALRGEALTRPDIVAESGEHRAYLSPPWKLIWYRDGRPSELFHLQDDPLELDNRASAEPSVAQELMDRLRQWVGHHLAGERTDPIHSASQGAWTCYIGRRPER